MQQGDLVHIPQGVLLFDGNNIWLDTTTKPTVGVFLRVTPTGNPRAGTYTIYALGHQATVARKNVYPMEKQHAAR